MTLGDVQDPVLQSYYIEVLKRLESRGIVTKGMPPDRIYQEVVAAAFLIKCKGNGVDRQPLFWWMSVTK